MAELPSFGNISAIVQETSGIFEPTVLQSHSYSENTTVEVEADESQSQSLLKDVNFEELQFQSHSHSENTTIEDESQSQSQSLLKDVNFVPQYEPETPMEEDSGPMSRGPDLDSGSKIDIDEVIDVDIDEGIEEVDLEQEESEPLETQQDDEPNTEEGESENIAEVGDTEDKEDGDNDAIEKLFQLPLSKIKRIMKTDQDTNMVSKEALVAMAISTEHFISMVAQQSYKAAVSNKKKTVTLNHVKATLASSSVFEFLEGALPQHEI